MAASMKPETEEHSERDASTSVCEDKFWFLKNLPSKDPNNFKNAQFGEQSQNKLDIPKIVRFSPMSPDESRLIYDRDPLLLSRLRTVTEARKKKDAKDKRADSLVGVRRFVHEELDVAIREVEDDDLDTDEECSSDDNIEDIDDVIMVASPASENDSSGDNPITENSEDVDEGDNSASTDTATPTPPPPKRLKQRSEHCS